MYAIVKPQIRITVSAGHTFDLQTNISRKHAYTHDVAILYAEETGKQWKKCSAKTWRL